MQRRAFSTLAAATVFGLPAARAADGAYPDKPIRMVCAYPAGGGLDFVTRAVSERLANALKQQVIIENKTGASGSIGADYVAKAAPDGYTLLMASPAEVIVGPASGQKTPYDAAHDLAPVALAGETPLVLVVNASSPLKTLAEFIAFAKAHPGELNYGTPGAGSSMNFAGEALKGDTGTSIVHIPYRGAAPAINDLLGNQVSSVIVGMPPVLPHVKAGKLRVLAVTSAKRSAQLPDVPAVAELPNMSGYRFTNWMTVFATAHTPAPVIAQLGDLIGRLVNASPLKERLLGGGVEPSGIHGSEVVAFLDAESRRYKSIALKRGIHFGS